MSRQVQQPAKITKGALYLLMATMAPSVIYFLGNEDIRSRFHQWLVPSADGSSVWLEGKVWQLITGPLVELRFVQLLLTGFMLWRFLPTLENWWGLKRFLRFAAMTSVIGSAAGTAVALAFPVKPEVAGLSPFIFASIVGYGMVFANQPVSFFGVLPMTGRQLTIGIVGFSALFIAVGQQWAYGASMAAAMAFAALICSERWSPRLWWLKRKQKKIRAQLKVVRDEDEPKRWMN